MLLVAGLASGQGAVQEPLGDAQMILKAMSEYVAGQRTIELTFDSAIEVITPELEKIQFTSSGSALVSRPDKIRAHRVGGFSDVELFFDGTPGAGAAPGAGARGVGVTPSPGVGANAGGPVNRVGVR